MPKRYFGGSGSVHYRHRPGFCIEFLTMGIQRGVRGIADEGWVLIAKCRLVRELASKVLDHRMALVHVWNTAFSYSSCLLDFDIRGRRQCRRRSWRVDDFLLLHSEVAHDTSVKGQEECNLAGQPISLSPKRKSPTRVKKKNDSLIFSTCWVRRNGDLCSRPKYSVSGDGHK